MGGAAVDKTMTTLEDFLAAVSSPLNFLATAPPDAAARTRLPSRALAERGRALSSHVSGRARADLQALCEELLAYDAAAPEQRRAHAERCRALVERLRHGSPEEAPAYRRTSGDPTDHLKAL